MKDRYILIEYTYGNPTYKDTEEDSWSYTPIDIVNRLNQQDKEIKELKEIILNIKLEKKDEA